MTGFKKITAIFAIAFLCVSGVFNKAQARIPKTLDGKESRFIYSEEETWSPCQDLRVATLGGEWWLENTGETFTDNLFYCKRVNLCFPVEANTISVVSMREEIAPANVVVATYLVPDFKQLPPGFSPDSFVP